MRRDTQVPNGRTMLGGLAHEGGAGANLALTMLPKAMAYAVVAGVPPVYGLYASCAAPALAIAFGSNRLLFTGPVGVMTLLVLGSLHHFAQAFSPGYIEFAASLTLMVGVLTLLFAAARLGFLVRAIPTPVTEGFIAAAALLIIGTQIGPALGAPPPSARSGIHLPAFLAEAAEAGPAATFSSPASSPPASPSRSWRGDFSRGFPTRLSSSPSPLRPRSLGPSASAAWRWWERCRPGCRRSPSHP